MVHRPSRAGCRVVVSPERERGTSAAGGESRRAHPKDPATAQHTNQRPESESARLRRVRMTRHNSGVYLHSPRPAGWANNMTLTQPFPSLAADVGNSRIARQPRRILARTGQAWQSPHQKTAG